VRTQYEPIRPHLCQRLSDVVCLFEFGAVFLEVGRFIQKGGIRKGVVCRNLGLFGQRSSV